MSFQPIAVPSTDQTEASQSRLPKSQGDWNKTSETQAIKAATSLAGCWRKDEAHDPLTFGMSIAAVFTMYSPDVVQYVCDPRTGLPKTHKWPPTISEVHDACTSRIGDLQRIKRYTTDWGSQNDNERKKDQGLLPPPPPEVRPTREEMKAKYGENWGLGDTSMRGALSDRPAFKAPTMDEIAAHYQNHSLILGPREIAKQRAEIEPIDASVVVVGEQTFDGGADF